ncbi:hypothetical protein SAMN00808754_1544 [Thermanaeromonas toyohensis ToBE]|uniref:Uncharacterized protein n=1 Tax=Thermanaeromonas toyohensis ToBE TaxID=698762 RepID=A0A1W1VUM2_9FIRM|nr:hypothetical protein [Thermanaeromonas toyohensis]SMB96584.1 hypothetical protein SAMN00808754_1544 [Thermanaeromonas toyohensis ToBE]
MWGVLERAAVSRACRAAADATRAEKGVEELRTACASLPWEARPYVGVCTRAVLVRAEEAAQMRRAAEVLTNAAAATRRLAKGIELLAEKEARALLRAISKKEGEELVDLVCSRSGFGNCGS